MSLVINSNTLATVTRNHLDTNHTNLQTSLARLASGSRIVKSSDDAGGLAVGNKLRAVVNRTTRAQQNVQNAISFLQVQDGALTQVGKILDRMSELKTMSLDVTKNALDIANYDAEFNQLQDQLTNIRDEQFNGINLFSTTADPLTAFTTAVGDGVTQTTTKQVDTITLTGAGAGDTFSVTVDGNTAVTAVFNTDDITTAGALQAAIAADAATSALVTATDNGDGSITLTGVTEGIAFTASSSLSVDGGNGATTTDATPTSLSTSVDLSRLNIFETGTNGAGLITSGGLDLTDSSSATSQNLADYTVDDFTTFIQNSATTRANNGAEMARLEASYAMLTTNHGNIEAARSRLLDVDIATESTHYAKNNILVQSSAAMLAQANAVPNIALQLIG